MGPVSLGHPFVVRTSRGLAQGQADWWKGVWCALLDGKEGAAFQDGDWCLPAGGLPATELE